jgi:hypothetical protein
MEDKSSEIHRFYTLFRREVGVAERRFENI